MAAVTAGLGRFIKRNGAGDPITGTASEALSLTEWDNTAAPRPVFYSRHGGRAQATPDDVPVEYNVAIRGTEAEILAFQVNPEATFTPDQADNALVQFPIKEFIYSASGRLKLAHERTLGNAQRITPAGGAGITHRQGLADGVQIAAGDYSDYLRFAPPENAEWVLKGRQRTDVHNNV